MAKLYHKIVGAMLGMLVGGAGCESDTRGPSEYGCPVARYILDGTVVDAKTEQSIHGIEVDFQGLTAYTDESGAWSIDESLCGINHQETNLNVRDVDGEENGLFADKVIDINLAKTEEDDSGSWNRGTYEARNIIVKLDSDEE